jgi:adenine-specific DNA-methyltransferase
MPGSGSGVARLRISPAILLRSRELRHPLTLPEQRLWAILRDHGAGVHIRRQYVLLGRFIADFYCASARLCIEIDGDSHAEHEQAAYDAARTSLLKEHGYRLIRFTNAEVMRNLEGVVRVIQEACGVSYV